MVILVGSLWAVQEATFVLNAVIEENVDPVFKWLQKNAGVLKHPKMIKANEKKYLVQKSIFVRQNVRK